MKPVRLRYLGENCHDSIVEHFFRCCPVALCHEDAEVFFAELCLIIDHEIGRVVAETRHETVGKGSERKAAHRRSQASE